MQEKLGTLDTEFQPVFCKSHESDGIEKFKTNGEAAIRNERKQKKEPGNEKRIAAKEANKIVNLQDAKKLVSQLGKNDKPLKPLKTATIKKPRKIPDNTGKRKTLAQRIKEIKAAMLNVEEPLK